MEGGEEEEEVKSYWSVSLMMMMMTIQIKLNENLEMVAEWIGKIVSPSVVLNSFYSLADL